MNCKLVSVISTLVGAVAGASIGAGVATKKTMKNEKKMKEYSDKHLAMFLLMNRWVKIKQDGKNLSEYFEKNGYKRIAIYGMSYIGETLVNELHDSKTKVVYGIDKEFDTLYCGVDIVSIEDEFESVDAIVVTAISYFDEIEEQLVEKINCPILSLEDIIYEV